jgi:hypothetical protein
MDMVIVRVVQVRRSSAGCRWQGVTALQRDRMRDVLVASVLRAGDPRLDLA